MTSNVHFVIAATKLARLTRCKTTAGTSPDPYIRFSQKDKKSDWRKVFETKHFIYNSNPEWLEVNSFKWKRFSGQQWKLDLLDYDAVNKNDLIESVEVDVDNFVLSGRQNYEIKLTSGGSIILKKTKPFRFRLQAKNIPKLDADSPSDPYVVCFWSYGEDGELHQFYKTKTINNAVNANWDEVIKFSNFQRGTNQYLTFKIYDKDTYIDDKIGTVTFHVDTYVRLYNKTSYFLSGPDAGDATFTITPVY